MPRVARGLVDNSAYNRINNIPDELISKLPIDIPNDWSKYINDKEDKTDINLILPVPFIFLV